LPSLRYSSGKLLKLVLKIVRKPEAETCHGAAVATRERAADAADINPLTTSSIESTEANSHVNCVAKVFPHWHCDQNVTRTVVRPPNFSEG
jgi:hypothetical protein